MANDASLQQVLDFINGVPGTTGMPLSRLQLLFSIEQLKGHVQIATAQIATLQAQIGSLEEQIEMVQDSNRGLMLQLKESQP